MFSSTWDERFMLLAHQIARWSKEKGRRVGAVIVGPDIPEVVGRSFYLKVNAEAQQKATSLNDQLLQAAQKFRLQRI